MGFDEVTISSTMVSRVTSLPHGVDPSYMRYQSHDVRSIVNPGDEIFDAKPVPWWIYLLAALGGLLLLLLVIYALYKVRDPHQFLPPASRSCTPNLIFLDIPKTLGPVDYFSQRLAC